MEYGSQLNYRPDDLSAKQDQIIQLVAQYVAYSREPSQLQFKVLERTNHNHNFTFMKEGDKAYNYYSFLLHSHMARAQAGYRNERYQRDQFSADYAQQLQQQEVAMASAYTITDSGLHADEQQYPPQQMAVTTSSAHLSRTTDEPPYKAPRVEPPQDEDDEDDDDDDAPGFKIIVDENGVQRIVKN